MEWSNDRVLEFVELLQGEPCIWDPKNQHHKNRHLVNDAWVRIKNIFSVPCSIEDFKKKRNSLLTQYRDCLKKIKESAAGSGEVYKPSWFAFDAIHIYMGAVYENRPKLYTVTIANKKERSPLHDTCSEESDNANPLSPESKTERPLSPESNSWSGSDTFPQRSKRQRKDEAFIKKRSNRRQNEKHQNECDLYGQLLSEKLKPLHEDDRLILMNEIDNLVFNYIINVRKRSSSRIAVDLQKNMRNSQTILNYDVITSTPFQTESQLSPQ